MIDNYQQIKILSEYYKIDTNYIVRMPVELDESLHKWRYFSVLQNLNFVINSLYELQGKLP
ncbi:hypothetical protein [Klebsiella phage phiKp_21]|nr:hypothetical protein DIDNDMLP_00283 [Klebsiella phage KP13-7]BEH88193.1 hypothetical protein [Klebsiella phage phiKp_21]